MKTIIANKSDLVRLGTAFGFQHEALLEFQRLGLIADDLSKVTTDNPFLTKMKKVWRNSLVLEAHLASCTKAERVALVNYNPRREAPEWERDVYDTFVLQYRDGGEIRTGKILGAFFRPAEITPEIRRRATQLRRAAAEAVRRERKKS